MMNNKKFEHSARIRKVKAFFLTAIITGAVFGGTFYATGTDMEEMMPEVVKNWLNGEEDSTQNEEVAMQP